MHRRRIWLRRASAAARKVTCRVMADGLGSRILIDSKHWPAMRAAGVNVASALPIGHLLLRPLQGRIDLRNHRKIVVIELRFTDKITPAVTRRLASQLVTKRHRAALAPAARD